MSKFLLKVWDLARPYRGRLLLGVATGIVSGLSQTMMIATVVLVYGLIFPTAGSGSSVAQKLTWAPEWFRQWFTHWVDSVQSALASGVQSHPAAIIFLIAAVPAVMLLRGTFTYLNNYFLQWAAIRTITDLRVRLFGHLVNLSAGFLSRVSTGELMARTMNDTAALQNIISSQVAVMVNDPVTLLGMLVYLLLWWPKLTLISVIIMPVCMVPILIFNQKVRRSSRALQTHAADLAQVMSESFTGNRVIKAYNLEPTVVEQFDLTARKFIGHYMRIIRASELPGPMLEFFGSIGLAGVLGYLVLHPATIPTAAGFIGFIGSIFSMYRPLKNLARLYNNLEQARAASERIFELLNIPNEIREPAQPKPLRAAGAAIRFENVGFSYADKPVLRGISLTIQPGQLIALVGHSGSGKTTLSNLLLRFYDPQEGAVRIGDTDIREVSARDLRSQIAVVTQETILFNETILRNIELGRPGAGREAIMAAAKNAQAYDFIMQKPGGFDCVVGEKGVLISGGQRQRLAIARAMVKDAPILILDEATSSLDTESERAVQAALEQLMVGRTTICIAHRLSTIQRADLIVVLDQGRMIETGTHAELLAHNGIYRRLYDMQFQNGAPGETPD